jgi:hypothetical protein
MVSLSGMFRLAFSRAGVNRHDLRVQETIFARIEQTITEILAE